MLTLNIPEIRDYERINRLVAQALDAGESEIALAGVSGQRLLLHHLTGAWTARITLHGDAGPELAFAMNAPSLTVELLGNAADGAGAQLADGTLIIDGDTGVATGINQAGGTILVHGVAGARAGLRQRGGSLILKNPPGPRAGERRSGGQLVHPDSATPP